MSRLVPSFIDDILATAKRSKKPKVESPDAVQKARIKEIRKRLIATHQTQLDKTDDAGTTDTKTVPSALSTKTTLKNGAVKPSANPERPTPPPPTTTTRTRIDETVAHAPAHTATTPAASVKPSSNVSNKNKRKIIDEDDDDDVGADDVAMSEDDGGANDDDRELCPYDDNCYRRNAQHFIEMRHPRRDRELTGGKQPTSRPAAVVQQHSRGASNSIIQTTKRARSKVNYAEMDEDDEQEDDDEDEDEDEDIEFMAENKTNKRDDKSVDEDDDEIDEEERRPNAAFLSLKQASRAMTKSKSRSRDDEDEYKPSKKELRDAEEEEAAAAVEAREEEENAVMDDDGDDDVNNGDSRPVCQYGAQCYRRNPQHFIDFFHPKQSTTTSRPPTHTSTASRQPTARANSTAKPNPPSRAASSTNANSETSAVKASGVANWQIGGNNDQVDRRQTQSVSKGDVKVPRNKPQSAQAKTKPPTHPPAPPPEPRQRASPTSPPSLPRPPPSPPVILTPSISTSVSSVTSTPVVRSLFEGLECVIMDSVSADDRSFIMHAFIQGSGAITSRPSTATTHCITKTITPNVKLLLDKCTQMVAVNADWVKQSLKTKTLQSEEKFIP